MDIRVRDLLRKLAAVEPLPAPEGEPGVKPSGARDDMRYIPILSVYLDWRPEATGGRPEVRAGRVVLKDRLREIARAFWPRGAAYDAVMADTERIERYVDEVASPSAEGLAIFACAPLGLFETLESGIPFESDVTARATPSLYQLALLLDDLETAIVAVVDTNTARLFVSRRGLLRELKGLDKDPKFFRMMKGANTMDQAHYHRYALTQRRRFAQDVSQRIDELVRKTGATQVILAGDEVATPLVKAELSPAALKLLHEVPIRADIDVNRDEIWEEIEPMVREAEAEQDRSVVERLVDETRAGGLGAVGLEQSVAALEAGQAGTLVLWANAQLPPETRSQLISLATNTDADVEIVDESPELEAMGGVGALLRYRFSPGQSVYVPRSEEAPGPQPTV